MIFSNSVAAARSRLARGRAHVAHPALAEAQQPAALQDRRGERVAAAHQLVDRRSPRRARCARRGRGPSR
jgi:hypothetical protein